MSILIKGMEMPTLYRTYKMRFSESGDGKIVVGIANVDSTAYRPIGEVISVPPHGALIDRDALMKKLNNCMFPSDMVTTRAVSMAMNWLKESPTIIPAEEGET